MLGADSKSESQKVQERPSILDKSHLGGMGKNDDQISRSYYSGSEHESYQFSSQKLIVLYILLETVSFLPCVLFNYREIHFNGFMY